MAFFRELIDVLAPAYATAEDPDVEDKVDDTAIDSGSEPQAKVAEDDKADNAAKRANAGLDEQNEEGGDEDEKEEEDDEEEEEDEDDEDEEEEEDQLEVLKKQCQDTPKCKPYLHHLHECIERVTKEQEEDGYDEKEYKEDCVEEFFHLEHCINDCAAPQLFYKLK
ncbi:BA75_01320T0 [Komagataella pastoris]|uniref:Cytochrome b-c1 complex subunit 6, mitochondrial n=1 Tax=Komagataella pastoris TaxID=4922 RepID=A0A1B2J5E5_PICPA|nr:BA75_01320T0 [Komagataella pastoris]